MSTAANASDWPTHFPATCCPPDDAQERAGAFFRLGNGTDEDFRSYLELERGNGNKCRRASLSVMDDEQLAIDTINIATGLYDRVFRIDLQPEHGRIKQTGKHKWHFSLWLRRPHHARCPELFVLAAKR